MDDIIGKSLGRYHVIEPLGEGGMAAVYRALDTTLERDVAIKVIRTDKVTDPQFIKRFEREAKALARLNHPHIVHINDYGEQENIPYLVMDFLPGGTLKQKLGSPMPYQEAARLLAPVARALEYAHENDVIHRDVKPANILLTDRGLPMLSDFGIAKLFEADTTALTGTGVGIGTPEYMAPEQSQGHKVDHRADIYALGVVFYELVTGRRPYEADTPIAVIIKHINDPLPNPRQFVPDLPHGVEQIIIKALQKDPENRYQDMGKFAEVLEKASHGIVPETASESLIASGEESTIIRTSVSSSRSRLQGILNKMPKPFWVGAGVITLLVLIGVIFYATDWFSIQAPVQETGAAGETANATSTLVASTDDSAAIQSTEASPEGMLSMPSPEEAEITFTETFDDDPQGWTKIGNYQLKEGALLLEGDSNQAIQRSIVRSASVISDNEAFQVRFRFDAESEFFIGGAMGTPGGIPSQSWYVMFTTSDVMGVELHHQAEPTEWVPLEGSLKPQPGQWYELIGLVSEGGVFQVTIWNSDNPEEQISAAWQKEIWADDRWYPSISINEGKLEIDHYLEMSFENPITIDPQALVEPIIQLVQPSPTPTQTMTVMATLTPTVTSTPRPTEKPGLQKTVVSMLSADKSLIVYENDFGIDDRGWGSDDQTGYYQYVEDGLMKMAGSYTRAERLSDLPSNGGSLGIFKFTQTHKFKIYASTESWNGSEGFLSMGIFVDNNGVSVFSEDGETYQNHGSPEGDLNLAPETWYYFLFRLKNPDQFSIQIWEPNNPDRVLSYQWTPKESWRNQYWHMQYKAEIGTLSLDHYLEYQD